MSAASESVHEREWETRDDELVVESVDDDGRVKVRMFGGSTVELAIPASMVVYYRRLVR